MNTRTLTRTGLATLSITISTLLFASAPATATATHELLGSFGPGGPGVGLFEKVTGIAVDQSNGTVYVYARSNEGSIYKFNMAGEPQEFSALKTNVLESVGRANEGEAQIAVGSAGPAQGDIYLANGEHVSIYSSSGIALGELDSEVQSQVPGAPWGEPCTVATDHTGNVYIGLRSGYVSKYTPTGNPVLNTNYAASMAGFDVIPCPIAVDSEGNVYVVPNFAGQLMKYPPSQFGLPSATGTQFGSGVVLSARTIAVDPSTNDVYDDGAYEVVQLNSKGELVGYFANSGPGAIDASIGIAVYAPSQSSEKIYVSTGFFGKTVEIFGPTLIPPVVSTGSPSRLSPAGSVTLEGTVNPENGVLTDCRFEYGTSTSYGQSVPCEQTPTGTSATTVTANVTGLLLGKSYHYRLKATTADGTVEGSDATFSTFANIAELSTLATGITQSAATLNTTIEPGNLPVRYHFEYGPTAAYGSVAPFPDTYVTTGAGAQPVTQPLVGLQASTTYHFAVVVTSPAGTITGPDETFTTPSVPAPGVGTGGSSAIGQGVATLEGTVDPMGWETAYHFEYGTSTAYGSSWPTVDTSIGSFTGGQGVSITVQGLQPATTYHYRLVATSPGGTTYGTDQTFTTAAYPLSVVQASPVLSANLGFINPEAKPGKTTSKSLTRAQKLTNAQKACKRKTKKQRPACEKRARQKYGPTTKKK
jgi:hypothetical protein